MKKYILAISDSEIPKLPLPPKWELFKTDDYSKGMMKIPTLCPYFLLIKNNINKQKAVDFLDEVSKRFGIVPPSIILGLSSDDEVKKEEKMNLGIVARFRENSSFKDVMKVMEPFLKEPPLPRMTILEFIANSEVEKCSGIFEFKISSLNIQIILKEGNILCINDEVFRANYRELLSQGGLDLPNPEKVIFSDIKIIDNLPFVDKEKIRKIKEFAIYKTLSGLPLDKNFKFTKVSELNISKNLIEVDTCKILRELIEKIGFEYLEVFKKCSLKKADIGSDSANLPLSPEEGYLLHMLEGEFFFNDIKKILNFDDKTLLRHLYLLFLLGLIDTNPSGGIPPRIQHLRDGINSREKLIFSQSLSIEQFCQTLQIPGLSPYKVLGIDEKSTLVEAVESFRTLENLFRPEELDPSIQKKYSKHLTFIRSKLTEAILLFQSFSLNGKQKKAEAEIIKMGKTERMGSEKTKTQKVVETRKNEATRILSVAKEYYDSDHIYEAGQYLKTALIYDPFSAPCRHLLALTYMKMKDLKSKYMAERELKIAIENDPWNIQYLLDLAKLYIEVDMPNRAKTILEQAQRIDPNSPEIKEIKELLKKKD